MRRLWVWVAEFVKLFGGRRVHPLPTQCPICHQTVYLHVNKAGRRHVFAHARCLGSGMAIVFDPRPNEKQRFKLPDPLVEQD